MSAERVTLDDVMAAGGCAWGIRAWFSANRGRLPDGWDMKTFLEQGVDIDQARAVNDGVLNRIIAIKEARRGQQ